MKLISRLYSHLNNKGEFFDLLLISLLGLLSFTWVEWGLIISGGDYTFNFSPLRTFEKYYSMWYDGVSTGLFNVQAFPQMVTFRSYYALSEMVGLPLFVAQRILFYFLFTAGGLSMYFLTVTVLKGKERRLAGLISAFFYMLNPFTMVIVWGIPSLLLFFYPVVPLFLALYIRGFDSKNMMLYVFLICFVTSIVFSAAYSVASFAMTTWFLIISFFIFYIIFNRKDRLKIIHAFKFTIILFLFWITFNLYWLLPYSTVVGYVSRIAVYEDSVSLLKGSSSEAGLFNTFRLFGYFYFDKIFSKSDLFYQYSSVYSTTLFIILSFLAPLLVFASLLIEKKDKFYILYFSVFSLAVLFLFKGSQPPLGEIYVWLLKNFPLMVAFRNPIDKFGSLLPVGYAFLFGYTISKLYYLSYTVSKFSKTIRLSCIVMYILIFLVFMFPFWTGQVFGKEGEIRPSWHTKVPDYYADANLWLTIQRDTFRIYPVPLMNMFGTPFDWEYGHGGADPRQFIFDKAIIYDDNDLAKLVSNQFSHGSLNPSDEKSVSKILGLLNVKYVLVGNDIKVTFFNIDKQSLLRSKSILKNEEFDGLKLRKSFDKLDFYELSEEYYLPKIYAPTTLTHVNIHYFSYGLNSQLVSATVPSAIFVKNYDIKNALFIQNFNLSSIDVFDKQHPLYIRNEMIIENNDSTELRIRTVTGFDTPALEFKRISPTKYRVIVRGFNQPFLLVFSENFDVGWKAYVRPYLEGQSRQTNKFMTNNVKGTRENQNLDNGFFCETCLTSPISENYHFKVNGYSNGWWVIGKKVWGEETPYYRGDIEVILEYKPQKVFYLGLIISTITIMLFVFYLLNKYLHN